MLKITAFLLFLLFSFSGCSHKPVERVVIQKELVCVKQYMVEKPNADIRIYKDDIEVARAYKEQIENDYKFFNEQVNRNNAMCDKENGK